MGLFGGIGKMLAGKPLIDTGSQDAQLGDSPQPGQQAQPGDKIIPVVSFGRIEVHVDGQRLDVYADARNDSVVPVFIDWVVLCGIKRQLDIQLNAGEVRQLLVYSGQVFANQPSGYAEVQYRTAQAGDYFIDYHEIRSEQEGDIGYRITELLQRGPVKEVH